MAACRCHTASFNASDLDSRLLGVDETNGRFGEVWLDVCRLCGTTWLRYLVEYEGFSESGRWYRAPISPETIRSLTPQAAVAVLEAMPWYFYGGSYFRSTGRKGSGLVSLDP